MDSRITELYSDADFGRMRGHVRRWTWVLGALAAAALAVCVVLVCLADTKNAQRMELATVIVSTVAGWITIYCGIFIWARSRRELAHAGMLRLEERERVEGAVTVTDERFTIRKSVTVRRVVVTQGEETHRLLVCDSRAEALKAANAAAVYTCHGYVAAYEVAA